jgi:hypothetical protein
MHHSAAEDLEPPGASAQTASSPLALEALYGNLSSGLDEGEIVAAETYTSLPSEDAAAELEQRFL